MMSFWQDMRYGLRNLVKSPGFAAIAIATLALGIGANTAMFTVMDGVLLKPLRYPDADRIVAVGTHFNNEGRTIPRTTGGDIADLRAVHAFQAYTYYSAWEQGIEVSGGAEFIGAAVADTEFFHVFSVSPVAGRTFTADDAGHAAVVSAGFATRHFGSPQAALGQTLRAEGTPVQIVGVMPAGFQYPRQVQVWSAISTKAENANRTSYNYYSVAKLAPGVTSLAANAQLASLSTGLAQQFPRENKEKSFLATPLREQLGAPVRSTMLILMAAVGLLLLIACANVGNLLLARATGRRRELAIRAALGAPRTRLVRQLLSEGLLLALAAGVVGVLLAQWGTQAMLAVSARFLPATRVSDIQFDWRVLGFALLASLLTSVFFGLAPAWQGSRVDVQAALKQFGSRGVLGRSSSRLPSGLVVVQIALSFVLAIGAGLFFRTFLALTGAQMGFNTEGMLVASTNVPAATEAEALRGGQFIDDAVARVRHLPGVTAAAAGFGVPTGDVGSNGSFAIEGKSSFDGDLRKLPQANFSLSGPGYFSTMGIPLQRGRDFNDADLYDRPFVVIISQSAARQNFGNEDPIGHRIQCGLDSPNWMTIVGVVGDVRQDSPGDQPGPTLYMPLRQHPGHATQAQIVVRTSGSPEALAPQVQQIIHELNPSVATKFSAMSAMLSDSVAEPRFRMVLAGSFGGLALLLALLGVYSVMSYLTAQRTSEFAVRMALGAKRGDIVSLVLRYAAQLAAMGALAGIALALAFGRVLSSMLFGLGATDRTTYAAVLISLIAAILVAAALPARRAAKVDPMVALRQE